MVALYDEYPPVISTQRTMRTGEWLFDRDLEARDNAALAELDREQAIENAVTFDDVLEEMAAFTDEQKHQYMWALRHGMQVGKHMMYELGDEAKQRIVARRMAEPQVQLFSGD